MWTTEDGQEGCLEPDALIEAAGQTNPGILYRPLSERNAAIH